MLLLILWVTTVSAQEDRRRSEDNRKGGFSLSARNASQIPDSLLIPDSTNIGIKRINGYHLTEKLGDRILAPMDTSRLNTANSTLVEGQGLAGAYTGNIGSPYQSRIFSERQEARDFIFADAEAIKRLCPEVRVISKQCSLFVALAEEGWTRGKVVEDIARTYLEELFSIPNPPDCLMLGCTHFPVFVGTLKNVLGPDVQLVDSAEATADYVHQYLEKTKLFNGISPFEDRFLATDDLERFARVGSIFLGRQIEEKELELVDL